MEGAFRSRELQKLGIRCDGKRPWLKNAASEPCDLPPRTMQRGSSTVWHPLVASALSIPPWGEGLYALLERERLIGASEDSIRRFARAHPAQLRAVNALVEDLLHASEVLTEQEQQQGDNQEVPLIQAYSRLRKEEYRRLLLGNPERYAADWQPFVCEAPKTSTEVFQPWGLQGSMLVKRLREVRALTSFVRGDMPSEADPELRKAPLKLSDDIDWLPAIEVMGEGVFLRLDPHRLQTWENDLVVVDRAQRIRDSHLALLRRHGDTTPTGQPIDSPVTPRYLLLHTLAHVLISEWSLDGGYPESALRERLYSGGDMAGVLIYTATTDSAGSLGGVVAQGEPERLVASLQAALTRAAWCSNDPLCMESETVGVDNVNLAACHACVLLPETSCETNNSFLDRALLTGTPDGSVPGYFPDPT